MAGIITQFRPCLTFILTKHNVHRVDIKLESVDVDDYGGDAGQELTESEIEVEEAEGAAAKHLANVKAGALKATATYVDLTEMDDCEH